MNPDWANITSRGLLKVPHAVIHPVATVIFIGHMNFRAQLDKWGGVVCYALACGINPTFFCIYLR